VGASPCCGRAGAAKRHRKSDDDWSRRRVRQREHAPWEAASGRGGRRDHREDGGTYRHWLRYLVDEDHDRRIRGKLV